MKRVPVYDKNGELVARVKYNSNLDRWNGHDMCVGLGLHAGFTRLKDGRNVIIHGSQWEGDRDYAEVVTDEEALGYIVRSENEILLKKYFPKEAEKLDSMEEEGEE
ncbi:MAG: hypothetical protein M1521_08675 [Thermotogae bacterium]|jgi:hypothetical protein|nr:hypothetical protein [Thermotogota bacterium]